MPSRLRGWFGPGAGCLIEVQLGSGVVVTQDRGIALALKAEAIGAPLAHANAVAKAAAFGDEFGLGPRRGVEPILGVPKRTTVGLRGVKAHVGAFQFEAAAQLPCRQLDLTAGPAHHNTLEASGAGALHSLNLLGAAGFAEGLQQLLSVQGLLQRYTGLI